MFERILVAVDSAGLAADAVSRGSMLARAVDSKLGFIHAVDVTMPMWPGFDERELVAAANAEALSAARTRTTAFLREALGDHEIDLDDALRLAPGPPAKVILHRAAEWDSELLVLGPHAKRGILDFGSTARAVLSRCDRPVWVQAQPTAEIERILVAVDFSEHSRKALAVADELAASLNASLRVLVCYVPPSFAYGDTTDVIAAPTYVIDYDADKMEADLNAWLDKFPWRRERAESLVVRGEPVDEIPSVGKDDDLIVMGTHGRTGLTRFLLGSVAYGVLKRSPKPLLVVPSTERAWLLDEPLPAIDVEKRPGDDIAAREPIPIHGI